MASVSQRKVLISGIWLADTIQGPPQARDSFHCSLAHTPAAVLLASFSRKGLLTPAFATSVFAVWGGWILRIGHMLQLTALDGAVLCSGTSCLFLHFLNGNSEISTSRLCDKSSYTESLGSQEKHRMRVANIYRERRMGDMGR